MIRDNLRPRYFAAVEGAAPETQALLAERFDYIFFTAGRRSAGIVMAAAARTSPR